ncbi:MAG: hypothetical protein EPO10_04130, partial [Reyranella sp.]
MGVYRFGQFELNEESRVLCLAGRELAVQPLVFDFLSLLLRHRDRALSKAELLDTLWPSVTVTEASLQRVASLARAILREGNMDGALRNLPRFGYRLFHDTPEAAQSLAYPADAATSTLAASSPLPIAAPTTHLAAARSAIAARKWKEAADAFAAADADAEGALLPADLEDWSLAIECIGHPSDAVPHLTRAIAGYSMSGQRLRAANAAISLSRIHLEKGELAVSSGWHKRAAS